MSCSRRDDLIAWFSGQLDPGPAADFQRHLESCPACAREKAELERLQGALALQPGETEDEGFVPEVMQRIRAGELPAKRAQPPMRSRWFFGWAFLPIAAIVVEALTHGTAEALADPFPTVGHLLVSLIAAIAVLPIELALGKRHVRHPRWLAFGAGAALAVGGCYAMAFLPALPIFAIALLVGIGLLGFGPLALTVISVSQLVALKRRRDVPRVRAAAFAGGALALLVLALLQAPIVVTLVGVRAVRSGDADSRAAAMEWMRRFGDPSTLRAELDSAMPWHAPLDFAERAALFFQITGEDLDSPTVARRWHDRFWSVGVGRRDSRAEWRQDFEASEFGRAVAARNLVSGLSLDASQFDVVAGRDAPVAYVEWTLTFKNSVSWQQEAKAQLLLPPGGVGSRLTLWIDGEEREAAYAATRAVTAAYEKVVSRRKDPALLTWIGPDRLQLRAFPVPARGTMKVKVGVTAPLVERDGEWLLLLPAFVERNFVVPPELEHQVWIDAPGTLTGPAGLTSLTGPDGQTLRGQLSSADLQRRGLSSLVRVRYGRSFPSELTIPLESGEPLVARLAAAEQPGPYAAVLVVDGSREMKGQDLRWATALAGLPAGSRLRVLLARQPVAEWRSGWSEVTPESLADAEAWLRRQEYSGGHDQVPALDLAWGYAAGAEEGRVFWVHGPQPATLSLPTALELAITRRPNGPRIYSLATQVGPERLLEGGLGRSGLVVPVPRFGDLGADLLRVVHHGGLGQPGWQVTRRQAPAEARLGTDHVQRFVVARWAEQVARSDRGPERKEALSEATRLRLITPFTGAVVLESQAQYEEAGLTPATSDTVPAVPEPATVGMAAIVAASAFAAWRRRRSRA